LLAGLALFWAWQFSSIHEMLQYRQNLRDVFFRQVHSVAILVCTEPNCIFKRKTAFLK